MTVYRCGWCGTPCAKDGSPLDIDFLKQENKDDYDKAEAVHGECCREEQEQQYMEVTREMAHDAGCPEMEGRMIPWG